MSTGIFLLNTREENHLDFHNEEWQFVSILILCRRLSCARDCHVVMNLQVSIKARLHGRFLLRFSLFEGCEGVDDLEMSHV